MLPISESLISRNSITNKRIICSVHYHEEHELYYMLRGKTTYYIGDEIYHIEEGNFAFIPRGILHKTDNENCLSNERILVSFSDDIFTEEMKGVKEELYKCRLISITASQLPHLENLLLQIEAESTQSDEYKDIMTDLYIRELLTQLCRYKSNDKQVLTGTDKTIHMISKYISTNFRQELSLKTLSKIFAMSESHLSRKFKASTGIGLNEYINYVRITNAEKLLRENELSITQIAEQCGYNDSNYFSTVFKRVTGMTPHKFTSALSAHSSAKNIDMYRQHENN